MSNLFSKAIYWCVNSLFYYVMFNRVRITLHYIGRLDV